MGQGIDNHQTDVPTTKELATSTLHTNARGRDKVPLLHIYAHCPLIVFRSNVPQKLSLKSTGRLDAACHKKVEWDCV